MYYMFYVRPCPPPLPSVGISSCMPLAPPPPHTLPHSGPHLAARIVYPLPFDSAGHILLVRRQQTAHPLRMGEHLGLCLRWLWLELGFGKLSADLAAVATS
eukprot:scaffold1105_cov54-Phaeocystis_antarctica.AAC.7